MKGRKDDQRVREASIRRRGVFVKKVEEKKNTIFFRGKKGEDSSLRKGNRFKGKGISSDEGKRRACLHKKKEGGMSITEEVQ